MNAGIGALTNKIGDLGLAGFVAGEGAEVDGEFFARYKVFESVFDAVKDGVDLTVAQGAVDAFGFKAKDELEAFGFAVASAQKVGGGGAIAHLKLDYCFTGYFVFKGQ